MSNESRLSIVVESRNAKQQAVDLAKALEVLDSAGVRVTATTSKAGKTAQEAGNGFSKAGKDAKSGFTGVDSLNKSIEQTDKAAAAVAASMRRMFLGALAGFSTMGLIEAAYEWGQYASRVKNATESAEEYEHVQKRMMASANRARKYVVGVSGAVAMPLSVDDINTVVAAYRSPLPRRELDACILALDKEWLLGLT